MRHTRDFSSLNARLAAIARPPYVACAPGRHWLRLCLTLLLLVGPPLSLGAPGTIEIKPLAASSGEVDHSSHSEHHDGKGGSEGHHSGALCLACIVFGGPSLAGAQPVAEVSAPSIVEAVEICPAARPFRQSKTGLKQRCRDPPILA